MCIAIALMIAVQAAPSPPARPGEPAAQCDKDGRCTVPDFSIGYGMVSNSAPARAVVMTGPIKLPMAVPGAPTLGPGKHELIVHWPGEKKAGFSRSFRTGAQCLAARAAILDEHRRRVGAIAVNSSNRGVVIAMELDAPYAICMPVD